MHSYKGKNDKYFNFNGDLSGELIITEIKGREQTNEIRVDFEDIINIFESYGYKVVPDASWL